MTRSALLLTVALLGPAALAQTPDLVGTWAVERATVPEPEAPADDVSALLPDNPFAFSPLRLALDASGGAVVTVLVPRADGYEVAALPSTYRLAGDRLVLGVGDLRVEMAVALADGALLLTSAEGDQLALRRE